MVHDAVQSLLSWTQFLPCRNDRGEAFIAIYVKKHTVEYRCLPWWWNKSIN
jgi:hypothetical protein